MRNKIFFTALFSSLLLATSCSDDLNDKAKLNVGVSSESATLDGDVYIVKQSSPITFTFSGNPDFISFYSGEPGREYSKRNLTESPIDQINSVLEFSTKTQFGNAITVPNTLKVMLTTEFTGLYGKPKKKEDSVRVEALNWIDITELSKIPQLANKTSEVVQVPLDEYLGKRLTIAFLYHTTENVAAQPVWEILDLKIVNTDKKTGVESKYPASLMGFTALDMYAEPAEAYKTVVNNTSGVWNLKDVADLAAPKMRIHSSAIGADLNSDWLISMPIVPNSRDTDKGLGIKNITANLEKYNHTYHEVGEYTITFVASNENMEHSSSVVRELKVRVVAN